MLKIQKFVYDALSESMKENYEKTIKIINDAYKNKTITSNEILFVKRFNTLFLTIHFKRILNEAIPINEENKKKKSFLRFNNHKITSIIQLGKIKKLVNEMIKDGILDYGEKAQQIIFTCDDIIEKLKDVSRFEVKIVKNKNGELVEILKEKKTCPCCFGQFEINSENKMVHHGYQRIYGFQTESCFGQGKTCFELSKDGTIEYIEYLENNIKYNKKEIENIEHSSEISIRDPKTGKTSHYSLGEKFFEQVKRETINSLNLIIRESEYKIDLLKERL